MKFSNSFIQLGEAFYQRCQPTPVAAPKLFLWNQALAEQMAIATDLQNNSEALARFFSGNDLLPGSEPIATAYAGHQFGNFNPQLGDGRAHLLGELLDISGKRWDLQLKGSGTSRFSRGGDGRCAMGPAVREFIMSEAMHALGVPTTRCLAVTQTGEPVYREQPRPGAVVTRMASSHLRVGTFQFFAARGDKGSLKALCDFAIKRHFPEIDTQANQDTTLANRLVKLLDKVIEKQIQLVIEWMRVGFIHGVMNTDNTAICGDTIDYGPCAMMGSYNPATVYSSIDTQGRYAFGNQPGIVQWNMARFAESLLPLIDEHDHKTTEQIIELIKNFPERYEKHYWNRMADKFGILDLQQGDKEFMSLFLEKLSAEKLDYTVSFNLLTKSLSCDNSLTIIEQQLGKNYKQWHDRITSQSTDKEKTQALMRTSNPAVIPRNHHIEAVLSACENSGEPTAAQEILEALRQPYKETALAEKFQQPAVDDDRGYRTFCGT